MSGFGSIMGMLFAFIAISGLFFGAFFVYQDQIIIKSKAFEEIEERSLSNLNFDFDFTEPFVSSGRVNFLIENIGDEKIFFKEDDTICFSFFENDKFVDISDVYMNTLNPIFYDYQMIDGDSIGIVSFETDSDFTKDTTYKIISCNGLEKEYIVKASSQDWWDTDYRQKIQINAQNGASSSISDYQIKVDINSSTYNFDYKKDDLRFVLPLKENLVLDLTFDVYSQTLQDYSKQDQVVFLGNTNGAATDDPDQGAGVISTGITFDGINDFVIVQNDNSLEIDKELTYAAFLEWNDSGSTLQNIFTNGIWNNALRVVNDGGVNDKKVLFELSVDGSVNFLYSNVTLDTSWHYVVATFDGEVMKLYVDENLVGELNAFGEIDTNFNSNFVGAESGSGFFFNGTIDELKVFNIALTQDEVTDLFYNKLRFRNLEYYVASWDIVDKEGSLFVKIPAIGPDLNVTFDMYFDNIDYNISSESDIESVFSYDIPRTVGYVVHDRISSSTGLNIFSLYDDNEIYVGDDIFNLDEQDGSTLGTGSVDQDDEIRMKYVAQVEGNGQADDMIVPISWAGEEFYFTGLRSGSDRLCMLSPWGTANVDIYDNGAFEYSGTVDGSGDCVNLDIATNNNMRVSSDIPILAYYVGGTTNDAFVLYPATDDDLYGVPSQTLYVAAGPSGASGAFVESDGSSTSFSLGAIGTTSQGGNGGEGDAPGMRIVSDGLIGAIQEADGDGTEATVFVPEYEMGTKFGSNEATDYIAVVSPHEDANCTSYTSAGVLIDNVPVGVGVNGVYKYDFDVGNDNLYANSGWKLECDKPVWPYYENTADNDDETNLFGHLQMRQFIYPEPVVSVVS
jgi:hypothetical protein